MHAKKRLAVFVGPYGRGSNMSAIAAACLSGELDCEIGCVIAPNDVSPAAQTARDMGIRVEVVEPGEEYGARLLQPLRGAEVDLICLAGYMRLLPSEVLRAYPRRIINIHPALLPNYGGKGMYGKRVHEAVLAAGDAESGASVHYVTENYDEGEVILQRRCRVLPGDTVDSLAARVLEEEHRAYVEAIRKVAAS